jgi:hypothetical protein
MEEFKSYIDSVSRSGDRTRGFVYVIILINFCVLAAVLNSIAPDWDDSRLDKLNEALVCSMSSRTDGSCAAALDYAKKRGFDLSSAATSGVDGDSPRKEVLRQLRTEIDYYQKKSVDENSFSIPVFNVPLDVNDLWILSGLLNCYLMFLLVVCFEREYDDLSLAKKYAQTAQEMELLIATQMLGKAPMRRVAKILDKIFKVSILFAPFMLHAGVTYRFFVARPILLDLAGVSQTRLILAICCATLVLLFYFGRRALRKAIEIDRIVVDVGIAVQNATSAQDGQEVRAAA